jgi:hypothetical protein
MAPRWGVVARGGGGIGGGGVGGPAPKQKRRGKAPRRFAFERIRCIYGGKYEDLCVLGKLILC